MRQMSTFSQGGGPDILGLCRVKPIHLVLSVAGGSLWKHERWHLSIKTTCRSTLAAGCGQSAVVRAVPGTIFSLRGRFVRIVPGE